MSINVILRAQGATSGGEIKDIGGEGTIDNRAEAEAALALVGSTSSVVIIGSDSFDRTRLERIRDGGTSTAVAGTSTASSGNAGATSLQIGTIRSSEDIPAGSRLYVFVDGNPSGGGIEITPDRAIPVTIPASTPDGSHEIQYRISRPRLPEVRYTRMLNIRPAIATLTNASVLPPPAGRSGRPGTSFASDPIKVRFTTSLAAEHRVRVNVGNHVETITVPAGAVGRQFDATLPGQPKTWTDTGGIPDRNRRYTVAVTVTPLGAGDRVGTTVNAGNVTISQPRVRSSGGGGGGGGSRPPRL